MFYGMIFAIMFMIVYAVYYFIFDDMLKKEKYTKISELVLFTNKFNLDKKKIDKRKLLNGVALINAFIMSFTATITMLLPFGYFNFVIAFVIIMVLLFSMYFTYGKYLNKKWGK